jgi:uncharacterized coiled-coil DUF342 family protein
MVLHGEMENSFYLAEDASTEIEQLKKERDELNQEVSQLRAKNGDLDLELQQTTAELEEVRSQLEAAGEFASESPIEAGSVLNALRAQFPKTRASLRDIEVVLRVLAKGDPVRNHPQYQQLRQPDMTEEQHYRAMAQAIRLAKLSGDQGD